MVTFLNTKQVAVFFGIFEIYCNLFRGKVAKAIQSNTTGIFSFLIQNFYNKDVNNNSEMFGRAKCKLCGDNVRFALIHLKEKHSETLKDRDVAKLNMSRIMEKFFK